MKTRLLPLLAAAVTLMVFNSCTTTEQTTPVVEETHVPSAYDLYVAKGNYPVTMEIYRDEALLAKAGSKSPIYICLSQQRGRLYVDGQVAADWPVSTGLPGHETPAGHFKVLEKKADYASNRYGKFYSASGSCTNGNADVFTQAVPEGGRFVGAPMPYWQRLTNDGVGMHIGKVSAGRRLSHGCIRTPNSMAAQLFGITSVGSSVTITQDIEGCYPARKALHDKGKLLKAKAEAEAKAKAEAKAAMTAAQA